MLRQVHVFTVCVTRLHMSTVREDGQRSHEDSLGEPIRLLHRAGASLSQPPRPPTPATVIAVPRPPASLPPPPDSPAQVFQTTLYDRVMIYKFHEDMHGEARAPPPLRPCARCV